MLASCSADCCCWVSDLFNVECDCGPVAHRSSILHAPLLPRNCFSPSQIFEFCQANDGFGIHSPISIRISSDEQCGKPFNAHFFQHLLCLRAAQAHGTENWEKRPQLCFHSLSNAKRRKTEKNETEIGPPLNRSTAFNSFGFRYFRGTKTGDLSDSNKREIRFASAETKEKKPRQSKCPKVIIENCWIISRFRWSRISTYLIEWLFHANVVASIGTRTKRKFENAESTQK